MILRDRVGFGRKCSGDKFGVEVELEGNNLPMNVEGWRVEHDGSLRGGLEYVFDGPKSLRSTVENINRLCKKLQDRDVLDSGRAGVHVHVNVQDMEEQHIYNFIILYLLFEEVLMKYCGDDRIGSLFCLRLRDAGGIQEVIERTAKSGDFRYLGTDHVRYAAINCKAIVTYGSLEFRAMRSTVDANALKTWVHLLHALKKRASQYDKAHQIIEEVSILSPEIMGKEIFGKRFDAINFDNYTDLVLDGMRECQWLANVPTNFRDAKGGPIGQEWKRRVPDLEMIPARERAVDRLFNIRRPEGADINE